MSELATELWVYLRDGRRVCERYNQREMAEFVRENMLERMTHHMPLVCFDGEQIQIPSESVERIEIIQPYLTAH
ncbi:MAG: hypothetical protein JO322_08345 [Candidatus Eremiobacteraeota bacterium]|nr:hypothetical protein [Candidatus Eremiobacteraeota bacterium]